MTLLSILVVGFLLGMKHATEADHLAAVATLATRRGTLLDALRQGAAWGLGHTCTLLLFGGVILALGRSIPSRFEQSLEFCVGIMLVLLGADVLRRLRRERIHFHAHSHGDGVEHVHAHRHAAARASQVPAYSGLYFVPAEDVQHRQAPHEHAHPALGRALLVGMMHGMAGSAALIVPSLGVAPSLAAGALYILVFGAGSIDPWHGPAVGRHRAALAGLRHGPGRTASRHEHRGGADELRSRPVGRVPHRRRRAAAGLAR